jgi:hypothetical protein
MNELDATTYRGIRIEIIRKQQLIENAINSYIIFMNYLAAEAFALMLYT